MQFLLEDRLNRCQIFWTVQFLKTESEPNFGFPHIPVYTDLSHDVSVTHSTDDLDL